MIEAREQTSCPAGVDPTASTALTIPGANAHCTLKMSHGYPLPDNSCTPGAINPTVTLEVLRGSEFKTGCERNKASTYVQKKATYNAYAVEKPDNNSGQNQTCELDHLISLELGGAETVDNIWPQCGPDEVTLNERYFKIKDGVENYLAAAVKSGAIALDKAQHGIAEDWTQYIDQAKAYWSSHSARGFGRDE